MEMNELKENVFNQIEENKKLYAQKKDIETKIAEKVITNLRTILLPMQKSINETLKYINKNISLKYASKEICIFESIIGTAPKIIFNVSKSNIFIGITYFDLFYSSSIRVFSCIDSEIDLNNCFTRETFASLEEIFGTEEKTQRISELMQDEFIKVLSSFSEQLKTENESLSESIRKLSEKLNETSTVTENEDGSVEIHIGGKTYVGTTKEA